MCDDYSQLEINSSCEIAIKYKILNVEMLTFSKEAFDLTSGLHCIVATPRNFVWTFDTHFFWANSTGVFAQIEETEIH